MHGRNIYIRKRRGAEKISSVYIEGEGHTEGQKGREKHITHKDKRRIIHGR